MAITAHRLFFAAVVFASVAVASIAPARHTGKDSRQEFETLAVRPIDDEKTHMADAARPIDDEQLEMAISEAVDADESKRDETLQKTIIHAEVALADLQRKLAPNMYTVRVNVLHAFDVIPHLRRGADSDDGQPRDDRRA